MKIFTIGFAQKSAKEFFEILAKNEIECLIDVRLNNSSQLAGFTKSKDLEYFLKTILNIDYIYDVNFAPTKELLDEYKSQKIDWTTYENKYLNLISKRKIENSFGEILKKYSRICLLCSEKDANLCHRKILAQYLKSRNSVIKIMHL